MGANRMNGSAYFFMEETIMQSNASTAQVYTAPKRKPVYAFFKRFFDILFCLIGLVPFLLVYLVVAIAIKIEDRGPVMYKSVRLTKNGKPFKMYKFRSMCLGAENMKKDLMKQNEMKGPAFKMKDEPRITKVGRILRKTSIDELPQLLNILKGDMSIIGPRPPLPEEVEQYTPYQMHRLDVKTGLACYHECMGRSDAHDFDKWVESDLKYIRERSLWTDIKIVFMTIRVVFTGEGAV